MESTCAATPGTTLALAGRGLGREGRPVPKESEGEHPYSSRYLSLGEATEIPAQCTDLLRPISGIHNLETRH